MVDKLTKNMTESQKILLTKIVISLAGISLVIAMILTYILNKTSEQSEKYQIHNTNAIIAWIIVVILSIIMNLLMTKIDIRPEKTKSKKLKIKYNNYEQIKEVLEKQLIKDNYEKFKEFTKYPYTISYTYKEENKKNYVIMMIKLDEMTEEIYQEYNKNKFEKLEQEILHDDYEVYLTIIICVDKVTKYFSKYTESNIMQEIGRYVLPVGISLASKTLYIATQEEGIYKGKYKKLKKKFLSYILE